MLARNLSHGLGQPYERVIELEFAAERLDGLMAKCRGNQDAVEKLARARDHVLRQRREAMAEAGLPDFQPTCSCINYYVKHLTKK